MFPINVTKSSMPSYEEYCEEIKCIWESRWLTNMGGKHRELESNLKDIDFDGCCRSALQQPSFFCRYVSFCYIFGFGTK